MVTIGLGLLVLAHAADYLTFLAMVMDHGIVAEANPIVSLLAQQYGLPMLTLAKATAVLLLVTVVIVAGRHRPRVAAGVLSVGIVVGSVGAFSNLASL